MMVYHDRLVFEEIKTLPIATVFFFDVEIRMLNVVRRRFQLNITTGTEVSIFAFGQTQCQFFNEGRTFGLASTVHSSASRQRARLHLDLHVPTSLL